MIFSQQDTIRDNLLAIKQSVEVALIASERDLTQESAEVLKVSMLDIQRNIGSAFAPLRVINSSLFALKPKRAPID